MDYLVIENKLDFVKALMDGVDFTDENTKVFFDYKFADQIQSIIEDSNCNRFDEAIEVYIEKLNVEQIKTNKIYEIAKTIEADEDKNRVVISSLSMIKAKSITAEPWLIEYWVKVDLPKNNSVLEFTEDVKGVIQHIVNQSSFGPINDVTIDEFIEALNFVVKKDDDEDEDDYY
jgi:hypothetical protein